MSASGESPDHAGRYLRDIQQWPDDRLESVHDFIQIRRVEQARWPAGSDGSSALDAFAARPELRENLRRSFLRMLRFYGLAQRPSGSIEPAPNFAGRSANWLRPENHNHLRITRILKCLTLLGLQSDGRAFFDFLETVYRQKRGQITSRTFDYWTAAVG